MKTGEIDYEVILMSVLLTGEVRVRPDELADLPTAAAPVSSPP